MTRVDWVTIYSNVVCLSKPLKWKSASCDCLLLLSLALFSLLLQQFNLWLYVVSFLYILFCSHYVVYDIFIVSCSATISAYVSVAVKNELVMLSTLLRYLINVIEPIDFFIFSTFYTQKSFFLLFLDNFLQQDFYDFIVNFTIYRLFHSTLFKNNTF